MTLQLLHYPSSILRQISKPVQEFSPEFKSFMFSLLETMYQENGAGISAIQVGEPLRAIIIDVGLIQPLEQKKPIFIINPIVTALSSETDIVPESCLSIHVPEAFDARVERPVSIAISFVDLEGNPKELFFDGSKSEDNKRLSRCLQHELDHLDGILFIDKLYSPLMKHLLPTANNHNY